MHFQQEPTNAVEFERQLPEIVINRESFTWENLKKKCKCYAKMEKQKMQTT